MRSHPVTGEPRDLATGVDGVGTQVFERNLDANLREISRIATRRSDKGVPAYRFAPLLRFEQAKSTGGIRQIHVPRIRDQIVLRVIHREICERSALGGAPLGFAFPMETTLRFRAVLAEFPTPYIVRADIRKFYDSVPRSGAVAKALDLGLDPNVAALLSKWSGEVTARDPWTSGKASDQSDTPGLPQGLSISASLAELWVRDLDLKARLKGLRWFRYVDDIVVVCGSLGEAEHVLDWLPGELSLLGLELSPRKSRVCSLDHGVPWLGMIHTAEGMRLDEGRSSKWMRKFASIRRKSLRALAAESGEPAVEDILAEFHRQIRAEILGRTSSRPSWFSLDGDLDQWRSFDSSLHSMIRSLHRIAGAPPPRGRKLPSVHRAIRLRRDRPDFPPRPMPSKGNAQHDSPDRGKPPIKG